MWSLPTASGETVHGRRHVAMIRMLHHTNDWVAAMLCLLLQVKRAVCTGLRSRDTQAWNFQLPVQDDAAWAQVRTLGRRLGSSQRGHCM